MSEVMTIRLVRKTKRRLERLAEAIDRTKSYVAAEAIHAYVDLHEWQIAEIKAAIREADAGDFASEEEVQATIKRGERLSGPVDAPIADVPKSDREQSSRGRCRARTGKAGQADGLRNARGIPARGLGSNPRLRPA